MCRGIGPLFTLLQETEATKTEYSWILQGHFGNAHAESTLYLLNSVHKCQGSTTYQWENKFGGFESKFYHLTYIYPWKYAATRTYLKWNENYWIVSQLATWIYLITLIYDFLKAGNLKCWYVFHRFYTHKKLLHTS